MVDAGRTDFDAEELAERMGEVLLARYGVICRDLIVRERLAVPWRHMLKALRRMEARGVVRGGRFITGSVGEQYALPEAVEALRAVRKRGRRGERVCLSAVDPCNLVGIVLPGKRVTARSGESLVLVDGALPEDGEESGNIPWPERPKDVRATPLEDTTGGLGSSEGMSDAAGRRAVQRVTGRL